MTQLSFKVKNDQDDKSHTLVAKQHYKLYRDYDWEEYMNVLGRNIVDLNHQRDREFEI